jgi:hypothetical protein
MFIAGGAFSDVTTFSRSSVFNQFWLEGKQTSQVFIDAP